MKRWTIDPPCEAELFLQKLFKEGKIDPTDTATKIHKKYCIFEHFSAPVFRMHFKRNRDKEGLGLGKFII